MYGCEAGTLFTARALMKKSPFYFNFTILVFSIVVFGQAIRICEAPISRVSDDIDYSSISESMWAVVVTMTTGKNHNFFSKFFLKFLKILVGYGDIYPRTGMGKFVMFLCSLVGVIIISVMVVAVTNKLEMSNLQSKAYTVISKIRIKKDVQNKAASILGMASRMFLKLKKDKVISVNYLHKFNKDLVKFRKARK